MAAEGEPPLSVSAVSPQSGDLAPPPPAAVAGAAAEEPFAYSEPVDSPSTTQDPERKQAAPMTVPASPSEPSGAAAEQASPRGGAKQEQEQKQEQEPAPAGRGWVHEVSVQLEGLFTAPVATKGKTARGKTSPLDRLGDLLNRGGRPHAAWVQTVASQPFSNDAHMTREMLRFEGSRSHTEMIEGNPAPRFAAPITVRCPPEHDCAVRVDVMMRAEGRPYVLGGVVFTLSELSGQGGKLQRHVESRHVSNAKITLIKSEHKLLPHPLLPASNTVKHTYRFFCGEGRELIAREEASEVRYSYLVPSLFLRHCVGEANVAAAVWRERYNEERHAQGYFDNEAEAIAHGRCVVRVVVSQALHLPKPGKDGVSHPTAGVRARLLDGQRPNVRNSLPTPHMPHLPHHGAKAAAVGETPLGEACAFAVLSVRKADGTMDEIGRTNTEYRTTAPAWGTNSRINQCPHAKPSVNHKAKPPARLVDGVAIFEFYLPRGAVEGDNAPSLCVEVRHERFSIQAGVTEQPLALYEGPLVSTAEAVAEAKREQGEGKAEGEEQEEEEWEEVESTTAGQWLPLTPDPTAIANPEGPSLLRLLLEVRTSARGKAPAAVPAPTTPVRTSTASREEGKGEQGEQEEQDAFDAERLGTPEVGPTGAGTLPPAAPLEQKQSRPFLRRRSSGLLNLSLPQDAVHFPLWWLKPHVMQMHDAVSLLADLSMSYTDYASSAANTWKSSAKKADPALQGIPTNLQVQTFSVTPVDPETGEEKSAEMAHYPFITLGASAAHCQGLEHGLDALLQRIQHLEQLKESYHARQTAATMLAPGSSAVSSRLPAGFRAAVNAAAKSLQAHVRSAVEDESDEPALDKLGPVDLQQRIEEAKVRFLTRRSIVVSQALSMLTTAFVSHVEIALGDGERGQARLSQWADIGFLLQVECLLSTQGKERAMLEDLVVGTEALGGFYLQLVRGNRDQVKLVRLGDLKSRNASAETRLASHEAHALRKLAKLRAGRLVAAGAGGNASASALPAAGGEDSVVEEEEENAMMVVQLHLDDELFSRLPQGLQDGELVSVVPLVFSQGINEMQSIANMVGDSSLQEEINCSGLSSLNGYFHGFHERDGTHHVDAHVQQRLWDLQMAVRQEQHSAKNTQILLAAADLVRSMNGARVTVCKSGKDRTAMSTTLEQARCMRLWHGLPVEEELPAANVMREFGVRLDIAARNIGAYKYSFNAIQRKALPEIYRPPMCTIQTLVTSVMKADS